jgi:hypothetical protein
MAKRKASMLTQSHREFVNGESEPSNARVYQKRIRDRIEAGLMDMTLLSANYDTSQIRQAFSGYARPMSKYDETQDNIPTTGQGGAYAPGAIAFLIEGLNYDEEPIDPLVESKDGREQPALSEFRKAVEQGVQQYLRQNTRYVADANVSIELNNIDHFDEPDGSLQSGGEQ